MSKGRVRSFLHSFVGWFVGWPNGTPLAPSGACFVIHSWVGQGWSVSPLSPLLISHLVRPREELEHVLLQRLEPLVAEHAAVEGCPVEMLSSQLVWCGGLDKGGDYVLSSLVWWIGLDRGGGLCCRLCGG